MIGVVFVLSRNEAWPNDVEVVPRVDEIVWLGDPVTEIPYRVTSIDHVLGSGGGIHTILVAIQAVETYRVDAFRRFAVDALESA